MARIGLSGVGDLVLMAICTISAIFFGLRVGLLVVGFSILTLCTAGAGITSGFIHVQTESMLNSLSTTAWFTTITIDGQIQVDSGTLLGDPVQLQ